VLGLFKRAAPLIDACELGRTAVALPMRAGCAVPPGCPIVIVDAGGGTRRPGAVKRFEARDGDLAWVFHPGPYSVDILPFAQAPELGLRTTFAIEADPAAVHQRFDLYLASEASGRLDLAALAASLQDTLQRELAQGGLELPPCATIEEWNAFRQGLNQLLYMRFGLTVDDCVPVDLGATRDYAAMLAARAAQQAASTAALAPHAATAAAGGAAASSSAASASAFAPAPAYASALAGAALGRAAASARENGAEPTLADARALRRLFLELPCLMCGLRMAALPNCPELFRQQQALLQRLDVLSVGAGAMPSLNLAAPGQPLPMDEQLRRARHSQRAAASLDEAWALLARMKREPEALARHRLAALYDDAERIVANLEADCDGRRRARRNDDKDGKEAEA